MIELRRVSKQYKMGDEVIRALDGVSLRIEDGEFVAITGPSGAGKSTLANIIGGLDTADKGEVIVNEEKISDLTDRQLSAYRNSTVGFVFQMFNLQPRYTALDNVMLPLMLAGVSLRKRRERALECLKAVGLGDRIKHTPAELSGGQRQRVSIARALVTQPRIIIADEPTGNLDSKKGQEIMSILKELNKKQGVTLLVITHDSAVAKQAKRRIAIYDGKIQRG